MSVLEIIRFRPKEGRVSALLEGRGAAVRALTDAFAMEHSTLTVAEDGTWVDLMRFLSRLAADDALAHELEYPEFADWVENVEEVVSRERLDIRAD